MDAENQEQGNHGISQRLKRIWTAFTVDWGENGIYGRSVQILAVLGQFAERARISEITVAPLAVNILKRTHNPNLTALAVFGIVGAIQGSIGHTWVEAMDKSPKTVEAINSNFPKVIEFAEDIGPAKDDRRWFSNIREGASTFLSYGVTPFVVAEKLSAPELSRKGAHMLTAQLTCKCALFGYFFVLALGEIALHSDPIVSSQIIDIVGKPLTWVGIAAAIEIPRLIRKRIQRAAKLKPKSGPIQNF